MRILKILHESPLACVQARLDEIPSVFARLIFLAETPRSRKRVCRMLCPAQDCSDLDPEVLDELQLQVFRKWLAFSTKRKVRDMRLYLRVLGQDGIQDRPAFHVFCRGLLPRSASPHERELFLGTLDFILDTLCAQKSRQ